MKEKFIKSSIILIIGGFITKVLGMSSKIIMTRSIDSESMALYMLILPTFSLLINLASFGLPTALSKLIAEDDKNNKKLLFSVLPFSMFINIFLIFLIILFAPILSNYLLKESRLYYAIISIALVIPFTSISALLRSYFFGKEKMLPHVISNIVEDLVRILLMVVGLPFFMENQEFTVCYLILCNIISELISIVVLFFFLPKGFRLRKRDIVPSKIYLKDSLDIGLPTTINRVIGSFTYFLEPIILTHALLYVGYSKNYILTEYGIISGYVMPILLLPSFFSNAISQALLPIVSKNFKNKNYKYTKKVIKQAIFLSISIGFIFTCFFLLRPQLMLKLIYNTSEGANYLKFLAPICLLQYIASPLILSLDAMGKSKDNLKITLITSILRTFLLPFFALFKIGIWALLFSLSINILVDVLLSFRRVKKAFCS
ncbi:MAG: oligosaccharide flippase family protein [Bacilli bacterium]|nr:oligosaccharide flippase family protein [Bacilli bacterium]